MIFVDLVLHSLFFVVQMLLLSWRYVSAIDASIALLLMANRVVFTLQLTVMSAKVAFVRAELIVQPIVLAQYLRSARVIRCK